MKVEEVIEDYKPSSLMPIIIGKQYRATMIAGWIGCIDQELGRLNQLCENNFIGQGGVLCSYAQFKCKGMRYN